MSHLSTLEIERRVLRDVRADLIELRGKVVGFGGSQSGQRRGLTRAINVLTTRLACNIIDDGASYSAEDIDEGLRA